MDFRADADIAGATSLDVEADFEQVPESDDARLLGPGVDLRITEIAQTRILSADVFEEITDEDPGTDDDGDAIEEVGAAQEQVFYIVKYNSDDPQWEPRNTIPDSSATIHLAGNEVGDVFDTSEGTMHRGVLIASAPSEADPESATLEVATDDKFQSLSLIDGSRVETDVEQVYTSANTEVEITSADEIDETFDAWSSGTEHLEGSVVDAFITPWLDRDNGGDGWAGSGKIYLSVEVDWSEFGGGSFDESTIYVDLDGDSTVKPENDPSSLVNAFDDNAVFAIPADTESATVVVESDIKVGGGSSAPRNTFDPMEAELEFSSD